MVTAIYGPLLAGFASLIYLIPGPIRERFRAGERAARPMEGEEK